MKDKIIPILLLIAGLFLIYLGFKDRASVPTFNPIIDSLQYKIDSLSLVKDSIDIRIDSVFIEIENNKKEHEENINIVLTNTPSEDLQFFTDYLRANQSRLDSLYNSK